MGRHGPHDVPRVNEYFIVEKRDIPGVTLTPDDWIVFKLRKYQIEEFREFEFDTCWVITAKALLGEVPEQIHLASADSFLGLSVEMNNK